MDAAAAADGNLRFHRDKTLLLPLLPSEERERLRIPTFVNAPHVSRHGARETPLNAPRPLNKQR